MSSRPSPPEFCAQCGAPVPRGARSCPDCGADERTGWRESSVYDGVGLPEPEDAADAPGRGATLGRPPGWRHALTWYGLSAAVLVVIALVLAALGLR